MAIVATPPRAVGEPGGTGLRELFRSWPTGVALVSAFDRDRPLGLACNSLVSVSLDPPLVGFFVAATSTTWPRLRAAPRLCVTILTEDQHELCRTFAARDRDRFGDVAWTARPGGPAPTDAVGWIDCSVVSETAAGDHTFVLAAAEGLELAEPATAPLVFHGGGPARLRVPGATS